MPRLRKDESNGMVRRKPVCPWCGRKLDHLLVDYRFVERHRVIKKKNKIETVLDDTEDLVEDPNYEIYRCPHCHSVLDLESHEVEVFLLHGVYPARWDSGRKDRCPHCGAYLNELTVTYDYLSGIVFKCPVCNKDIRDIDPSKVEQFLKGDFEPKE
jgi:uncharacterized protein with PIN domain